MDKVYSMCLTYRHDFGLLDDDGIEKKALISRMRSVYLHHIQGLEEDCKHMRELELENAELRGALNYLRNYIVKQSTSDKQ